MKTLSVNKKRLMDKIFELSGIGALKGGGVQRLALTEEDRQAREWLLKWMESLALKTCVDPIGNMFGFWGKGDASSTVLMGSHLDTVGTGGIYDGSLGVIAAMEIITVLQSIGLEPTARIGVVNFTNEEGVRFTPDMMGSLFMSKGISKEAALRSKVVGSEDLILQNELQKIGFSGDFDSTGILPTAYLELHIEQGPVLEHEAKDIGVVEKVQGIHWTRYTLMGLANHAGTTPMDLRKDAGYVMSKLGVYLRELAVKTGHLVGTIGSVDFCPNLINVIPEKVSFTIDLRHPQFSTLQEAQNDIEKYLSALCSEEGVKLEKKDLVRADPVDFDPHLVDRLHTKAKELGYNTRKMISGAGHDAQMMAGICPSAMIFIPSKQGLSHNVNEYSSPDDIEKGANLLLNVVATLSGMGGT